MRFGGLGFNMYLVIAYHGKGNGEVESDLRVLWGNLERLAKIRKIEHIFCFQAVKDNVGADVLMMIKYEGEFESTEAKVHSQSWNNRVDYWFYIRNQMKTNE